MIFLGSWIFLFLIKKLPYHFHNPTTGQVLSLCMRTHGDFILVGDLMRSMSLLLYNSIENTVKEIARDFTANWMNAVEVISDEIFIGAENEGNLFVLQKNLDSITEEERARLELQGMQAVSMLTLGRFSLLPPLLTLTLRGAQEIFILGNSSMSFGKAHLFIMYVLLFLLEYL